MTTHSLDDSAPMTVPASPAGRVIRAQFGDTPLSFDSHALLSLYLEGNCEEVSTEFIRVLQVLQTPNFVRLDDEQLRFVNEFLKLFLHIFTEPDFIIAEQHVLKFLAANEVLANLLYLSDFSSSDQWLTLLASQQRNLVRLLTLYSSRNELQLNASELFGLSEKVTSQWFTFAVNGCFSFGTEHSLANHIARIRDLDARYRPISVSHACGYLTCSYAGIDNDVDYKTKFNAAARKAMKIATVDNQPDKDSLAVVSGLWFSDHVVYRNNLDLIEWLKRRFRLTLIYLEFDFVGQPSRNYAGLETSAFADVRVVSHRQTSLEIGSIMQNDFAAVFYTDIGMVPPSIFLSNVRIAPVQITGYGHPVSTFGSEIDYFIGGSEVESLDAQDYYSEKLVLVPGLGVNSAHARLLRGRQASNLNLTAAPLNMMAASEIRIACCWGQHKINYDMLRTLVKIAQGTSRPVRFIILTAAKGDSMSYLATDREIQQVLSGVPVELHTLPLEQYLAKIDQCSFALDAFPFGGFNTIADVLSCGQPVVAWEGHRAYNRLAAAFLRRVGLQQLIASDEASYISLAIRLIEDRDFYQSIVRQISQLDVADEFERASSAADIGRGIEYVIDHHDEISGAQGPIQIS